jgi:hypothetical protein
MVLGDVEAQSEVRQSFHVPQGIFLAMTDSPVALCDYTDLHTAQERQRVYRSLCVQKGLPSDHLDEQGYFPPERPMENDPAYSTYLGIFRGCRAKHSDGGRTRN